jgi:hypothetical protein
MVGSKPARNRSPMKGKPGSTSKLRRLRGRPFGERSDEPGFRQRWSGHRTRRDAIVAGVKDPRLETERTRG